MPFFFTNAWMLAGMAALSVPILIHLLLRRKKKRLRFSSLQFFLMQDQQSSQRRKLRHWLLLVLRLSICALLVLAFARPFLPNPSASDATRKRQVILLLDRSLSLQASALNRTKWSQAKEAAQRLLADLKADDQAALIGCGLRAEALSPWAPPSVVKKVLEDLQPTAGGASLVEGLQQAVRLLAFRDSSASAALYLVSDLQRTACQNLADCPLPADLEVKVIGIGDAITPNLVVADLQLQPEPGSFPHAVISSHSDEDFPQLKFELLADGQLLSSESIALPAGASTNLNLAVPMLKPGWHEVIARVQARDGLPLDDARYDTLFVPEPARVLIVETRPSPRSFEEESFFVAAALDPGKGSSNAVPSRFTYDRVSVNDLAAQLAAPSGKVPYDLVVLPALKQVPQDLGSRLTAYLQSGGGVLLFLGEGVSANRYNGEFRSFLPARLGTPETFPDLGAGWRLGRADTNSLLFSSFRLPSSGDLSLARFVKRFALEPQAAASTVAQFLDGTPLALTLAVGSGRVVLVNTSADTAWNDWPKHKSFVPWLHGVGRYLTQTSSRSQETGPVHLIAGADEEIPLGAARAKSVVTVVRPSGSTLSATADDQGILRDVDWSEPGVYGLRDAAGVDIRRVAVNVPAKECDLAALTARVVETDLARQPETRQAGLTAGLLGTTGDRREFWRVLLVAVLILLVTETLIGNRTIG